MIKKLISIDNNIMQKYKGIAVELSYTVVSTNFHFMLDIIKEKYPDIPVYISFSSLTSGIKQFLSDNEDRVTPLTAYGENPNNLLHILFTNDETDFYDHEAGKAFLSLTPIKKATPCVIKTEELEQLKKQYGIRDIRKTLMIGSFQLDNTQEIIMYKNLIERLTKETDMQVIIVPNNVNSSNFDDFYSILRRKKIDVELLNNYNKSVDGNPRVVMVDRRGLLKKLYNLSRFTILGGSFNPFHGIQNPLEPAGAGNILFIGYKADEYKHNNAAILQSLQDGYGLVEVTQEEKMDVVVDKLKLLMDNQNISDIASEDMKRKGIRNDKALESQLKKLIANYPF